MDPHPHVPRRSRLLPVGLLFLAVSFVVTALAGGSEPGPGAATAAWLASAAFWVGMVCIAGHVLRLVLMTGAEPSSTSSSAPPASTASWGETERWGPPSQR